MTTGEWYHVVFTYDKYLGSQNMKLFVNTQLGGTTNDTGGIASHATLDITIGTYSTYWLNGYLGGYQLFDRALSFPEILQLFLATKWRWQ